MPRTVISLSLEDKRWLDSVAKSERIPMTEIVRRAITKYRKTRQTVTVKITAFDQMLNETFGIWKKGDAVAYTRKLREEWDR
jgi:hypothetical protein